MKVDWNIRCMMQFCVFIKQPYSRFKSDQLAINSYLTHGYKRVDCVKNDFIVPAQRHTRTGPQKIYDKDESSAPQPSKTSSEETNVAKWDDIPCTYIFVSIMLCYREQLRSPSSLTTHCTFSHVPYTIYITVEYTRGHCVQQYNHYAVLRLCVRVCLWLCRRITLANTRYRRHPPSSNAHTNLSRSCPSTPKKNPEKRTRENAAVDEYTTTQGTRVRTRVGPCTRRDATQRRHADDHKMYAFILRTLHIMRVFFCFVFRFSLCPTLAFVWYMARP